MVDSAYRENQIILVDAEELYFDQQKLRSFLNSAHERGYKLIVVDEIQSVPCWVNELRNFRYRHPEIKVIVCGSQSDLIRSTISTLLTGQHLGFMVRPYNFREFVHLYPEYVQNQLLLIF